MYIYLLTYLLNNKHRSILKLNCLIENLKYLKFNGKKLVERTKSLCFFCFAFLHNSEIWSLVPWGSPQHEQNTAFALGKPAWDWRSWGLAGPSPPVSAPALWGTQHRASTCTKARLSFLQVWLLAFYPGEVSTYISCSFSLLIREVFFFLF